MPYELALGLVAAAGSALLPFWLKGQNRWAIPSGFAVLAGLVVGIDELRGEGPWCALIEGGAVFLLGVSPLGLRGLVRLGVLLSVAMRNRWSRLLRVVAVAAAVGAVGLGVVIVNAARVQDSCDKLLVARATPYRLVEKRLNESSWLVGVQCEQAYRGEEIAQTCRWPFGRCWVENGAGTAAPAAESP